MDPPGRTRALRSTRPLQRWRPGALCGASVDPSRGQCHRLHGQSLAWGLHGGLAGAPVLLVLSALAGVAALELGGVRASDRDLDDLVRAAGSERLGAQRQDAVSAIARRRIA